MNCRIWAVAILLINPNCLFAQRQMERIDRGLVAVRTGDDNFISWRLFVNESPQTLFDVYRIPLDGPSLKINSTPITAGTNIVDTNAGRLPGLRYRVQVVDDTSNATATATVPVWKSGFFEIPIQPIPGYRPGDMSIADLDGDGEYEFVLHQVSNPKDNSHSGVTGSPILDAYEWDGRLIWRIDLGKNIREGEHYTQFMVYDLDGDGKAEVACKTADGTSDGRGKVIGDESRDWRELDSSSKSFGRVLKGPEYLTIFSGESGEALSTVGYLPAREPIDGWGGIGGNGGNDNYGNRCDRFLACVAYLDGERPSLIACRGVYGRIALVAWDYRDGQLTQRWMFDSGISYPPYKDASIYSGMGGHSLSVADVDEDGRDEIIYQAMVVDDNGQGLYSTGLRHGDAMHVSDFIISRPGLEVFSVQENEDATIQFNTPGAAMRDAKTGEVLWSHSPGVDVPAGLVADIDPRYPGCEAWGGPGGLRSALGEPIGPSPRSTAYAIWWDGDLLRELVGRNRITKWDFEQQIENAIFSFEGRGAPRGPNLIADIIGDWREEIVTAAPDGKSLRVYTSTIPTEYRIHALMQDAQYRLSVAWQNVAYNRPPFTSFFLGHGMDLPPRHHSTMLDTKDKSGSR